MPEIDLRLVDRQGVMICDLPEANLETASWVLNAEGEAVFEISPLAFGARKIKTWDTELQIWWDDWLGWWGPVWTIGGGPNLLKVTCKSVVSLLYKRFIDRTSIIFGNASATPIQTVDQFAIAFGLIDYAQSQSVQPYRDLNIDGASILPSGVGRTMQYKREEHKNILDLLKEFPDMFNGFDWDVDLIPTGKRFWHPYYPQKGVRQPQFTMEYSAGSTRNLATFTYTEDSLNQVTEAYCTGGSVNSQKIEERWEALNSSERHGVMQGIVSEGSVMDRGTLVDRARKEVILRAEPIISVSVNSIRTLDLDMFGILSVGDWLPLHIDWGRIQVYDDIRVKGIKWNNNDTLTLDIEEVVENVEV